MTIELKRCIYVENGLHKEKITKKGCDYLIANDISRKDIGFGADENEVTILNKNGDIKKLEKASKSVIALEILEYIKQEIRNHKKNRANCTSANG